MISVTDEGFVCYLEHVHDNLLVVSILIEDHLAVEGKIKFYQVVVMVIPYTGQDVVVTFSQDIKSKYYLLADSTLDTQRVIDWRHDRQLRVVSDRARHLPSHSIVDRAVGGFFLDAGGVAATA